MLLRTEPRRFVGAFGAARAAVAKVSSRMDSSGGRPEKRKHMVVDEKGASNSRGQP